MSHHSPAPDPHPAITLISGGQTGADRAALDFALAANLTHGGWCPRGRLAEDGPIPARYTLRETPSANYLQRTEWNVRDSDGTVVFAVSPCLTGGTKRTAKERSEAVAANREYFSESKKYVSGVYHPLLREPRT